jgi:hypothetical protein
MNTIASPPNEFKVFALRSSLPADTVDVSGPLTISRSVASSSVQLISLNVLDGASYTVQIKSSRKMSNTDAPIFLGGSCDASRVSILSTQVDELLRKVTISGSGTLLLRGGFFPADFSVSIGEVIEDCSTTVTLPSLCVGRVVEPVHLPTYLYSQLDDSIRQDNVTFAALSPQDYATNSLCYQAFMEEMCRLRTPRCDPDGKRLTADICYKDCADRYASKGCSNSLGAALCVTEKSCQFPPLPVIPRSEPILPPATPRPPRSPPRAAPSSSPSSSPNPSPTATPLSPIQPGSPGGSSSSPSASDPAGSPSGAVVSSTSRTIIGSKTALVFWISGILFTIYAL